MEPADALPELPLVAEQFTSRSEQFAVALPVAPEVAELLASPPLAS